MIKPVIDEKGREIGYKLRDIKKELKPKVYKKFLEFLHGQTVSTLKNETIIYEIDVSHFLKGLPAVD